MGRRYVNMQKDRVWGVGDSEENGQIVYIASVYVCICVIFSKENVKV